MTKLLVSALLFASLGWPQFLAPARRIVSGATLPATCTAGIGAVFTKTGTGAGLYQCLTTNTWTLVAGSTGAVGGATTLTEVGNVPRVSAAGVLGLSKLRCTLGVCTVYDDTAVTGVTTFEVRAGAGQSTTNLQEWKTAAGTAILTLGSGGLFSYNSSGVGLKFANNNTISIKDLTGASWFNFNHSVAYPHHVVLASDTRFTWSGGAVDSVVEDLGISRTSAGLLQVNNGTAGQFAKVNTGYYGSATNTVQYGFRNTAMTSGTAAAGFGAGSETELENASGTNRVASAYETVYTDATNATEDARVDIKAITAGGLVTGLSVLGSGISTTGTVSSAPGGTVSAWRTITALKIANGVNTCTNADGCWQVDGAKVADAAASPGQLVPFFTLPANGAIEDIRIKSVVACTNAAGTATITDVGLTGTAGYYSTGLTYDLEAAVADTNLLFPAMAARGSNTAAATAIGVTVFGDAGTVAAWADGCSFKVSFRWAVTE